MLNPQTGILLVLLMLAPGVAPSGEHWIAPVETDTAITGNPASHLALRDESVPPLGSLLLFFPGTNATPADYTLFARTASDLGYHVISLSYENLESINLDLCPGTRDTTCHRRARHEVWFGEDTHSGLAVTPANSVVHRLRKLLQYLAGRFQEENWGQYLAGDTSVVWNTLVTAGHSQGGGHAAFGAKLFPVKRAIMISWTDWMWPGRNADWVTMPGAAPDSAYRGFIHTGDASIYYGIPTTWTNLGMLAFGPILSVDSVPFPYLNSHALRTSAPIDSAPTQTNFHNATAVDWMTPLDPLSGEPAYRDVWQYLLGAVMPPHVPGAMKVSPDTLSSIDPEFLQSGNLMAFQTGSREVHCVSLDPLTGLMAAPPGPATFIDSGATVLTLSMNGPEFGVDTHGWSLFYTRSVGGVPQVWRAVVGDQSVQRAPLTGGQVPRLSVNASKDPGASSIRLLYSLGQSVSGGMITWTDEDAPEQETVVDTVDIGARWMENTQSFIRVDRAQSAAGQLSIHNTTAREETVITQDQDLKTYGFGWYAPEFGSRMALAIINDTTIGVYRDGGVLPWERFCTIPAPERSAYRFIGSPEPFVSGGRSFVSFVTKERATSSSYVPAEVWVAAIDPDPATRLVQRCDDGAGGVVRTDPESYVGTEQAFIYYNLINGDGTFEIWRFATGIGSAVTAVDGSGPAVPGSPGLMQNYPNPFNPVTTVRYRVGAHVHVKLVVFDVLGRAVQTLVDEERPAGEYAVRFDAGSLASGTYFYRIVAGTMQETRRMMLLK